MARVFPRVGGRLAARCLRELPNQFADAPAVGTVRPAAAHGRLAVGARRACLLFLLRFSDLHGQDRIDWRSCVSEFSSSTLRAPCAPLACYVHTPWRKRAVQQEPGRQRGVGRRPRRGPCSFTTRRGSAGRLRGSVIKRLDGLGVVRPIRFLFALDEAASAAFMSATGACPQDSNIACFQQNNPACPPRAPWTHTGHRRPRLIL